MGTKFSEDVVPLTDLKVNPGRKGHPASRLDGTDGKPI